MARLSDIPKVYRSVGVVQFSLRVWDEVNKDNLLVWASALAYSWLFAIFPFFIFLLAVLHYMPERTREMTKSESGTWWSCNSQAWPAACSGRIFRKTAATSSTSHGCVGRCCTSDCSWRCGPPAAGLP